MISGRQKRYLLVVALTVLMMVCSGCQTEILPEESRTSEEMTWVREEATDERMVNEENYVEGERVKTETLESESMEESKERETSQSMLEASSEGVTIGIEESSEEMVAGIENSTEEIMSSSEETEEPEETKENGETEPQPEQTRKILLTLTPGTEEGQLCYGYNPAGNVGPEAFVVEDDTVYLLDTGNKRVVIYKDGSFSSFDISDCPYATYLVYQNGLIGVMDDIYHVTGIYTTEGEKVSIIKHPETVREQLLVGLVEVTDSYVTWKTIGITWYRYFWNEDNLEMTNKTVYTRKRDENTTIVKASRTEWEWEINTQNIAFEVLKVKDGNLIYEQFEYVPFAYSFVGEKSVRMMDQNGNETFSYIDSSEWYMSPTNPIYVSTDGTVYLMDCFDEYIVISEVILGTTEESRMEELYAQVREEIGASAK